VCTPGSTSTVYTQILFMHLSFTTTPNGTYQIVPGVVRVVARVHDHVQAVLDLVHEGTVRGTSCSGTHEKYHKSARCSAPLRC
jgi:hypothetical protein